jgi:hypothetical protein
MSNDQLEKAREKGSYPAPAERIEKRTIDPTLFPKPKERKYLERLFDVTEKLFDVGGKLVLAILIAAVAIWVYPDGFLDTPFASLTFKDLLGFIASILLWIVALAALASIFIAA